MHKFSETLLTSIIYLNQIFMTMVNNPNNDPIASQYNKTSLNHKRLFSVILVLSIFYHVLIN